MNKAQYLKMADGQHRNARDCLRWAMYYRRNGNLHLAEHYAQRARCYLRCARMFVGDARGATDSEDRVTSED